jgi:hypothetical protein
MVASMALDKRELAAVRPVNWIDQRNGADSSGTNSRDGTESW